jgi:hypothetical protein
MKDLHHRYQRFSEWKQQPHQVAPLSEVHHECATCGTHYEGNYCPRCGQSSKIGRYSFKNALLLYLDVWGLGNRGMFRTIRDLILRPGYMIRDYLRGMQMAYFPPFKLFFLLLALSVLVDSGMNIQGINREKQNEKESEELVKQFSKDVLHLEPREKKPEVKSEIKTDKPLTKEDKKKMAVEESERLTMSFDEWLEQHGSVVVLAGLLVFSFPLYLLFRHSPAIPDLRFSECFVSMVYITDMFLLYNIIPSLLCFSVKAEIIYNTLTLLLPIIPIKQMSGYSYWSTFWRLLAAFIPFVVVCFLLFVAIVIGIFIYLTIKE